MKKFFTLCAAAAVVVSASAASHDFSNVRSKSIQRELKGLSKEMQIKTAVNEAAVPSVMKAEKKRVAIKSIRKADGIASLEGTWEWEFGDYLYNSSTQQDFTIELKCEYEEEYDDYLFFDPEGDLIDFCVLYDASTSKITIPWDILGSTGTYLVAQEPYIVESDGSLNYDIDDLDFNFNQATKSFEAVEMCGISWGAYDPDSFEYKGDFDGYIIWGASMTDGGGSTPTPGDEGWVNVGKARLMDGWVIPAWGLDQRDYIYEVPLQQKQDNGAILRLVDPYHLGPLASQNTSSTKGYIMFDVTDPDHVVFLKANAGFANSSAGVSTFYCWNNAGSLMEQEGIDLATLISLVGNKIPYTTLKNGVVSLGSITTSEGVSYDANFGIQGKTDGGYCWTMQDGTYADMTAAIYLPEITGINEIINRENVSVEYFNLQGIRIANPEKGQIVIMHSGNTTSKTVVR